MRRADGNSTVWINNRVVSDGEALSGVAVLGRVRPDGGIRLNLLPSKAPVDWKVGQTLQVRNSDELLHNVHSESAHGNDINMSQPKGGMAHRLSLRNAETMVRITCDVHRWMTAFVGIVDHPYFATTGAAGTFTINNVPVGTHTVQAWHEQYGTVTQIVRVTEGATTTVDFTYAPSKP